MRDQRHPEDLVRQRGRFFRVFGEFDATTLAAPSGVNLSLDDDTATQFFRASSGFIGGEANLSARNRNVVLAQDLLRLILVNFHEMRTRVVRSGNSGNEILTIRYRLTGTQFRWEPHLKPSTQQRKENI